MESFSHTVLIAGAHLVLVSQAIQMICPQMSVVLLVLWVLGLVFSPVSVLVGSIDRGISELLKTTW